MKHFLSFLLTATYTYFFYSTLIYIAVKIQTYPNLYPHYIMKIVLLYAILMLVPCLMSFILSFKEIKNWFRVDLLWYFGASLILLLMRFSGDMELVNFYEFFFVFTGMLFIFCTIGDILILRKPRKPIIEYNRDWEYR